VLTQGSIGFVKGTINSVPSTLMGLANGITQGAVIQGELEAGVDVRTALADGRQATAGWWNGQVFSYDNPVQRGFGFLGELAGPVGELKALSLLRDGIVAADLGATLDRMAYSFGTRTGTILSVTESAPTVVGNMAATADGLASRNVWRDFAGQGVDLGGGAYGPTPTMMAQALDTGGPRAQRLAEAIRSGDVSVSYSNLGDGISGRYFPGTNEIELNGNMNWSGHGGLYDAATTVAHEGQHWMDDVAGIAINGMKSNEMYFEGRAFLAEQRFADSVGMPQLGTLGRLEQQLGSRSAAWDFIKSQYGY
jgi:hypothetical protein